MKTKVSYLNKAQLQAIAVQAHTEAIVASRRFGKSILIGHRIQRNATVMPGSTGAFVASSYRQAHSRTLPSAIAALRDFGFIRDVHYVLGKKPPRYFAKPIIETNDFKDVMTWWTGAQMVIISQDVKLSANSMTLDWLIGDEAKGLNFKKLKDETLPANGGTKRYFADCPWHHSVSFFTDMPVSKEDSWIFRYSNLATEDVIQMILQLIAERNRLIVEKSTDYNKRQLSKINKLIADFRRNSVYYREWDIYENIEVVGLDYVKQMKRDLPPLEFQTSILSRRITSIQGGFYPAFKESIHTYIANNNSLLENEWQQLDDYGSMLDADVDRNAPIAIAFDYNANINWLVAGQINENSLKVTKSFYVKYDRKLREIVDDFCNYYKSHPTKQVVYYYDSTALGSNYAASKECFSDIVHEQFSKNGWLVEKKYLGNPMKHSEKYRIFDDAFKGYKYLMPLLNKENNSALILSISLADVDITNHGFGKKKAGEKLPESSENPLEYRTDGSDAFDTLVIGCCLFPYNNPYYFTPNH